MVDTAALFITITKNNTFERNRWERIISGLGLKEKRTNHTGNDLSLKAETERFELSIQLPVYTLSRRAPSATRTRLQFFYINISTSYSNPFLHHRFNCSCSICQFPRYFNWEANVHPYIVRWMYV